MKKLLRTISLLSILFLSFSCSYTNQKVDLRLSLAKNHHKSNSNNEVRSDVKIKIIDDREDKNLGIKEFGDIKITISSDRNLVRLLQREVNDSLDLDMCNKDYKKILELHIIELDYKAKRAFFVGSSEGTAKIQVRLLNSSNKLIFNKNYEFSLSQKHFISSLKSTDKAIIEKLIDGVFAEILTDKEIMKVL